ncbi:MAG: hypothetical protein A3I11_02450 [Elusimicrobia bacterium RIFCSPLOWO2_02_FULL_39_32]|nr:MAG: hypothetical protein A2034_02740 [Elusimicrobia bacterium GWA2_38_7]OGR78478.1 MAG: hypothetical protein A3B80_07335 [Elusimicrobia bacterium RIFCSPHIGHO2_02_FULL_39_36]OGR92237.1 MAG: hypothetical protein A3I11_02450 [Elusimicrobia bacterium RIFCSPLOWO2_02_FULL_39_32]
MAIRINSNKSTFTGGELIELKDSNSYIVSSFNSTIPTGRKDVDKIITGQNSRIKQQMIEAGNDIYSLPTREVFYLVRGKKHTITKVCLVHGSFFETIGVDKLINQAFSQVLEERLKETGEHISDELKAQLLDIFSKQDNFSKVRDVERASVKIRFRIMTEVKAEGNILNSKKYPEIKDNTLNFILPFHNQDEEKEHLEKMKIVFGEKNFNSFDSFKIKHHFNGYFLAFQILLR